MDKPHFTPEQIKEHLQRIDNYCMHPADMPDEIMCESVKIIKQLQRGARHLLSANYVKKQHN